MPLPPAFCINTAGAMGRWESMTRRFAAAGLTVTRWEAATPATLGSCKYAHYLSPGQRGCAKSHYDLWRYQVENAIPAILIFEDDAVLRHDFVAQLTAKLATVVTSDPEWDMLLLNASEETTPLETWQPAVNQCLTACYVLSLRGAKELLRVAAGTLYASDWMTQILQRRRHSYTYFPWLVIQDENESIIRGGRKNTEDWEKVKRLLAAAGYDLSNYSF